MIPRANPRLLRLFLVLILCLPAIAAASQATDGWQKLWRNQNVAARIAFRAALRQNPSDPSALRGIGLLALQEDDSLAALQAWRLACKAAPDSALLTWPQMVALTQATGRWDLLEGAAQDILAARNAAPELRASARMALAAAADHAGQTAVADRRWAEIGMIRAWNVIGPFDNISHSGFEKSFPPENEIDFHQSVPGQDDQPLRWHRLEIVSRDGQCEIGTALGDAGAEVYYAVTAIFSPREQPVLLQFDPTGASKIIVNGRLVFADDTYRVHQALIADPFQAAATLHEGWNTVLLKLADDTDVDADTEDGSAAAAFALRFTTPTGADVPGLRADPNESKIQNLKSKTVLPPSAASPAEASPAATSVEPTAVQQLRRRAGDTETAVALGYQLLQAKDYPASAEALRAALKQAPDAGWIHWELSRTLLADGQNDEAHAERDLARKDNARLIEAELDYLQEKDEAFSSAETLHRLSVLLKINPGSAQVHWALYSAYRKAKLTREALKAARLTVRSEAGVDNLARLIYAYQIYGQKADADAALTAGLRAAPNAAALLTIQASRLADQGRVAAAVAVYQHLLQIDAPQPTYRLQIAHLYEGAKDLKKTAETLAVVHRQRPQDAAVCAQLADVLHGLGRSQEAIALYRTAVRLDPAETELRDKLQLVSGEKPIIDLAPPTPTPPILAAAPKTAQTSALILLDEDRQVVYPDYATVLYAHKIVKVFDAAGVQRFQNYPLGKSSYTASVTVESARLLKADGKTQDMTEAADAEKIAFPSLAPGDVIDVAYRIEDYPRGGLARQFWAAWFFATAAAPVKLSRYVLIAPPDFPFQSRNHGAVPPPGVKDVKGWRVREWRMADVPARKQELMGTGPADADLWLDISTVPDWSHIVAWYRDLSQSRCAPDASLRAQAAELTKDAKTETEKIRAIVAFTARHIQYQTTPFRLSAYVPTEGKQVMHDRYGDCKDKAALLTALLSAVGIRSDMVLLSGRSEGITPFLPSPRFSHAIACVQTASGPLWVDATADQMEFGNLPFEDQGVPALVIDPTTTDLTMTPTLPAQKDLTTQTYTAVLSADGRLNGETKLDLVGNDAWILRTILQPVPEAKRDDVLRAIAGEFVKNCVYESGSLENQSDPDKPMGIHFKFHLDHYGTTAGNFLLSRLPWNIGATGIQALSADTARLQDLETAVGRGREVNSLRLELPPGYVPQDLQPEIHGESPWGTYRLTYHMEGNVLHAECETTMTALRVPVQEVTKYIAFWRTLNQEGEKQIVFKKP